MSASGRKGVKAAIPFLLPSLIGALLFSVLPILVSLFLSITNWTGMSPVSLTRGFFQFVGKHFVGLENFKAILSDSEFYKVLSHNLYFIVLYLPSMLLVSMACALIINSPRKTANVYRVLYYIPVLTSWVAGALIWKWLLSPTYGPINNVLALLGIEGPMWLQSEAWAMPSIVIASVWKDMGFYAMIILGGLKSIGVEYYEAANIDGAGKTQCFFRITLPLLSSVLFYVIMLSLINAFQLFPQVMVMTRDGNAGPNGATMVMVERIYKYAFKYGKMGYAAAYSWLLFAVIMIFTVIQKKGEKKWVNYES
ncbi:MAG: sugar ABC transporter permease [Sphaerochaetaceae bacterium]|jgi:multiple sugar transport system permease protein|nr:sugar ABC transporter permease [Sphaerochaetaceae bacterium]